MPGAFGAPMTLLLTGTPDKIHRWLPGIVAGEKLLAFCATEPGAGSDIKTLRTAARSDVESSTISMVFLVMAIR